MKNKKEKIENWKKEFRKMALENCPMWDALTEKCVVEFIQKLLRQEKSKDRQRFIEILERLKIEKQDDSGVYGFIESGYNQAVNYINQKIQEAINQLKDEK
jgi:ABC-type branched-subunit amino acid transport system substrate-binding protein